MRIYSKIVILCLITIYNVQVLCTEPTFEIKNKSAGSIQIDLVQNGSSKTGLKTVAAGKSFAFQLDISKETRIDVSYCPTIDYCKTQLPDVIKASIKPGKTVYIKFDGKNIKPQVGNSFTGKTTTGYSIKNNITLTDISITKTSREKLRTGTKESIAEDIKQKNKKQQPKVDPIIKPLPLVIIDNEVEKMAWKLFPEAYAYLSKGNDPKELARLVLGVSKQGSSSEITKAYHKASLKYHPDKFDPQSGLDKKVSFAAFNIVVVAKEILTGKQSDWNEGRAKVDYNQDHEKSATRDSTKDKLISLFSNPPDSSLETFAIIMLKRIAESYDKPTLEYVKKKTEDYPARDFGGKAADDWKKNIIDTIIQALREIK